MLKRPCRRLNMFLPLASQLDCPRTRGALDRAALRPFAVSAPATLLRLGKLPRSLSSCCHSSVSVCGVEAVSVPYATA